MEANIVFILLALLSYISYAVAVASTTNETDRSALLVFKSQLSDPAGVMSSWNDSNHDVCRWQGVSCSHKHPDRVAELSLSSRRLSGSISPFIANLTFLQSVNLADNGIYGEIPTELGRLRRLQFLNLSYNALHGEIPISLTNCSNLMSLILFQNRFTGKIPIEFGSLSKLDTLNLGNNSLSGLITPYLGNLTSLTTLSLVINHLDGLIPNELGKITSLEYFDFALNMISGEIPPSIYNLTSLQYFGVAFNNMITGRLPPSLGTYLPNLQFLFLAGNKLHGHIPVSVTNLTGLTVFNLAFNNFSGIIPSGLGKLQHRLRYLNLGVNQLEANSVADWVFMDSLSNCTNLQKLILSTNMLRSTLPQSAANLSTQLQRLELSINQISGSIPSEIGNLISLNTLELQDNLLTGAIPSSIGKLANLYTLALFHNSLGGVIPSSIGNLTQLLQLRMDENNFEGNIPPSLGKLKSLIEFDLSNNNLSGNIPGEIFGLTYLANYMDLSYNSLNGSLPIEVGGLSNVGSLLIRSNKLSGELPSSLGMCASMQYLGLNHNFFNGVIPQTLGNIAGLRGLNLSENNLSGSIPQSLSKLKGIQELYLSHNNLVGPIPEFLENLTFLRNLTLSYNHLQGEVPKHGVFSNATDIAILSNDGLCGGIEELHLPSCSDSRKRKWSSMLKIVVIVIASLLFVLLLSFLAYVYRRKSIGNTNGIIATSVPVIGDQFPKISYRELAKATDWFSSINLIGSGRYGSVYKGTLDGGKTFVAVKVFNLMEQGATKSFIAECDTLRNIRHRNLIKILTSCSSSDQEGNDFKALVFEYMPNGSLDALLYPEEATIALSLIQRLNIAIDVANALEYLHDNCQPPIVHCDLKPGNVLLDGDMGARVGDFGLAKLYSQAISKSFHDSTSSIGIRGTIGYVAPEYGAGGNVTVSGDMYSYGILLLEMFTGKRPVDDIFRDGLNLCKFVDAAISSAKGVMEIADPSMLLEYQENTDKANACLESVMRVGLRCAVQTPSKRMHISDVVAEMHSCRKAYFQSEQ